MNVNLITNMANPLYTYKKEKANEDKSFANILEAYSAEQAAPAQVTEYTSSADEIRSVVAEDGSKFTINASYTVTEEEAEYFREKYGENYNEETVADLFFELVDEGIISDFDASRATCCMVVYRVDIIGAPPGVNPYKWAACPPGMDMKEWAATHNIQFDVGERKYAKSRNIFEKEYEDFKRDYTKEVITWEDYIQEQRDFYEYLRNRDTIYDVEGNQQPNNPLVGYDERLEGLERAAAVIMQIFG